MSSAVCDTRYTSRKLVVPYIASQTLFVASNIQLHSIGKQLT